MFENTNNEYVKSWEGRDILFLHGQESGPVSSKYTTLLEAFPGRVYAPDFQGMGIDERYRKLSLLLEDSSGPVYLVGSSYGGLLALMVMNRTAHLKNIAGCLLLVPAVSLPEADYIKYVHPRTKILAVYQDEYIPTEAMLAFAEKHSIETTFVNDGHRLLKSNALMVKLLKGIVDRE